VVSGHENEKFFSGREPIFEKIFFPFQINANSFSHQTNVQSFSPENHSVTKSRQNQMFFHSMDQNHVSKFILKTEEWQC
jgi:hypothetical protein